jgi:phosphatidylserine/phosphatidylglycerophosphate/cardiolipin synthase-like enzyme
MQLFSKGFEMKKLLEAIIVLVRLVPPEKMEALAYRVRTAGVLRASSILKEVVGTPPAAEAIDYIVTEWKAGSVAADELAGMLLASSHAWATAHSGQASELVWTGPTTPFVSTRHTEQVLLQVINSAENALFITSFVAYEIPSLIKALVTATDRGVKVSMLIESSANHGGSISTDAIGRMKQLVPAADVYAWLNKSELFTGARVHAKVAVADSEICFITSANLTGFAMEKNMEAGVLISGGNIPFLLADHLTALVRTNIITKC